MKTRLLTVMLICLGLITSNSTYGQIECKLTKEGTGIWHLKLVRDSINIDGVNYQFHLGDYTLGWNGGTNYPENVMPDKVSILTQL